MGVYEKKTLKKIKRLPFYEYYFHVCENTSLLHENPTMGLILLEYIWCQGHLVQGSRVTQMAIGDLSIAGTISILTAKNP